MTEYLFLAGLALFTFAAIGLGLHISASWARRMVRIETMARLMEGDEPN